jgi:predicted porin
MRRKLLSAAVVSALGVPACALAQSSTVQIYGVMYMEYSLVDQGTAAAAGGGAPIGSRNDVDVMQTPGSAIGFKGEEKLGGGLSAWFQCESTADITGVGAAGWCARNSAVGLKGGFGNVFLGNWDTPFKRTISPLSVGGNDTGIWGTAFLLTGGSTTVAGSAARGLFKRRQNNTMNYDSPVLGGFQVMAAFSTAQTGGGAIAVGGTAATTGATAGKPRVMSLGAQYSAGPLYIGAGYERHNEFAGVGGENNDDGWHLGAAYTWGPVKFGGLYTRQTFETSATTESRVSGWHVGADWKIVGPHGLRAAYTMARDVKGTGAIAIVGSGSTRPAAGPNTGADLWQVRYVYAFSKRTEFNFGYVKLDNEAAAFYTLGGLGAAVTGGNNQDAWAASLRHTF